MLFFSTPDGSSESISVGWYCHLKINLVVGTRGVPKRMVKY
jgi:hypothetical protein